MNTTEKVVTRFAPSPTGKAHAGSYRTAMYAWLFARKHSGKFILRIEDTDKERNDTESEKDIYEALAWLGLSHDELYIQSKNLTRHQELLNILIQGGKAYISKEEAKDGSGIIKEIIRFKNPNKKIAFIDLVRGEIETDTTDLGDFVIARNINEPLYHLAVVIDDHDEGVTHVIRAEEHIANTPRQILIIEALGWVPPAYAHIPIVLGSDKQKLSKRKGALPMTEYAKQGYLRDAVFNCIAMIGWNPADPGSPQELFTTEELIERFDFTRVQKSGAVFNIEKLNWYNREYLKKLSFDELFLYLDQYMPEELKNKENYSQMLKKIAPILLERIEKGTDLTRMYTDGDLVYFFTQPQVDVKKIIWKGLAEDADKIGKTKKHLEGVLELITKDTMSNTSEEWKTILFPYADANGRGDVLWPTRVALSGQEKSPDPFVLIGILGKEESIGRLTHAISLLSNEA